MVDDNYGKVRKRRMRLQVQAMHFNDIGIPPRSLFQP